MKRILYLLIASLLFVFCGNQTPKGKSEEPVLKIKTSEGTITVKLYKETPLHRDNFMQLVDAGYYNGIIFHRVIKGFMIQAGETGKTPTKVQSETNIDFTIPAEIVPQFFHKRGTLAAARMGDHVNPEKASSPTQFYIVHTDDGAKHLDGSYTVFGEVIDGFDVIDIIANKTVINTRPAQEVKIISILPID
ncbi:MAG: peptidylprolyl isomerase [Bacteroidales bacterium]|nr:peptidylprolyl isomerase [Bacteroidales bacterium]